MWLLIPVYLITTIFFGMLRNRNSIYWFIITIVFQNIILIILSPFTTGSEQTIFSLIKEGMLYQICIVSFLIGMKKIKITLIDLLFGIYFVFLIKNLLISPAEFSLRLISFRQSMIPILGYYVGKCLIGKKYSIRPILSFIVTMAVFISLFGIVEMTLLNDKFWINIGFHNFLINKQGELISLYNGVTRNFYTWDFGNAVRRFVSITCDPLASAHLVYLGFLIIVTKTVDYKNIKRYYYKATYNKYFLYAILFFICCILSFSKAIYIFMGLTILIITYSKTKNKMIKNIVRLIAIVGIIVVTLTIAVHYGNNSVKTSITNHIDGLISGFENASILGNGFGIAGVMAKTLGGTDITTSESYIGTLAQQIGYIGIIFFIIINIRLFMGLYRKYKISKDNFTLLCIVLSLGLLVEMFFSESSVSIMGTSIYFILIGISYNIGSVDYN